MKIGTKSILFGVHQFLWHPLTVALAWKRVHRRWPNWWESVCIAVHDLGYWGSPEMDGIRGKLHPLVGAWLAQEIVWAICALTFRSKRTQAVLGTRAYMLTLYHSSWMAKMDLREPSALYLPDKVSILHDPDQFYLLRAKATGEIKEYVDNSPMKVFRDMPGIDVDMAWLAWYCVQVEKKLDHYEKTVTRPL